MGYQRGVKILTFIYVKSANSKTGVILHLSVPRIRNEQCNTLQDPQKGQEKGVTQFTLSKYVKSAKAK